MNKGTVSRALRGIPGVGPTTRQRIIATADRLDFSASHLATTLAGGRSRTVGLVLPTLRSWYFSEFAAGASSVLAPAGYQVELINLDVDSDDLDPESATFRRLFGELGAGRGRDALLLAGTISIEEPAAGQDPARVPAIATGSPLSSVPGIYIDHRAGGRLIGEHLIGLGHRRIVVIDGRVPGKPDHGVWENRTQGLRAALVAAGLDLAPTDVVPAGDCHPAEGEQAMTELLNRPGPRPTAVFCHTDELAFGAFAVLRRRGIHCPDRHVDRRLRRPSDGPVLGADHGQSACVPAGYAGGPRLGRGTGDRGAESAGRRGSSGGADDPGNHGTGLAHLSSRCPWSLVLLQQ